IMSEQASGDIPHLSGNSEAELDQAFAAISREVEASSTALATPEAVEAFRLQWLGRKQGRVKARKRIGQRFNTLKAEIEQRLEHAGAASGTSAFDSDAIDITLPGTRRKL